MTTDNVRLLKKIAGAIKSGMDAHGLDASLAGSLAKRVLPVVRAELDNAKKGDIDDA